MKEYLTLADAMHLNINMENKGDEKPGVNNVERKALAGKPGSLRNKLLDIAVPGTVSWNDSSKVAEHSRKEQEEQGALEALIGSIDPEEQKVLQEKKEQAIEAAQKELDELKGKEGFRVSGGADLTEEAKKLIDNFKEGIVPPSMSPDLERTLLDNGISPEDIRTKSTYQLIILLQNMAEENQQNPDQTNTNVEDELEAIDTQEEDSSTEEERTPGEFNEGQKIAIANLLRDNGFEDEEEINRILDALQSPQHLESVNNLLDQGMSEDDALNVFFNEFSGYVDDNKKEALRASLEMMLFGPRENIDGNDESTDFVSDKIWRINDNDIPVRIIGAPVTDGAGNEAIPVEYIDWGDAITGEGKGEIKQGYAFSNQLMTNEEVEEERRLAQERQFASEQEDEQPIAASGDQQPPNEPPVPPAPPINPDNPDDGDDSGGPERPELPFEMRTFIDNYKRGYNQNLNSNYFKNLLAQSGYSNDEINSGDLQQLYQEVEDRAGENIMPNSDESRRIRQELDRIEQERRQRENADGAAGGERTEEEDQALRARLIEEAEKDLKDLSWLDIADTNIPELLNIIDLFRFRAMQANEGLAEISSGHINEVINKIQDSLARTGDTLTGNTRELFSRLLRVQQGVILKERADLTLAQLRRRGEGRENDSPYDPPKSIEDLIEENMKYASPEYREGGEKALMYTEDVMVDGRLIKDVKRVNFENLVRYIHDIAVTRGAVAPQSPINYFAVLKLRYGYNSYTLEDLLLNKEIATVFLPKREEWTDEKGEIHRETKATYDARSEAYLQVRDNLSSDLWIRQSAREKHMTLEYGGALGSDTEYPNQIIKLYGDNVFTRSDDFEKHLNLSTALSYSPKAMNKRVEIIMRRNAASEAEKSTIAEELLGLDDNIDGHIFRRGISSWAHLNDFKSLIKILGTDSIFFDKSIMNPDSRRGIPKEFIQELGKLKYMEETAVLIAGPPPVKWEDLFNADGKLDLSGKVIDRTVRRGTRSGERSKTSAFTDLVNIFNAANKATPIIEAVRERMTVALAEKAYIDLKNKYEADFVERYGEKAEHELWKNAFEAARYEQEDSYYWTSFTGINTGDNDPTAAAFRAKTKPDSMYLYFNKQLDTDRGQFPGNQYLISGITRMSTTMVNAIRTIDGRSILDVVEGRTRRGDTSEFNFDKKVENVTFANQAMSFYAENHVRRVFKLFNEIVDAKELGFNSFITRDPGPFGEGRLIIDKAKAQETFAKWKDWRYIFNEVPMDQKIRAMVGQDKDGNYLYREMTIAEAFFSKELLHEYLYEGSGSKRVDGMLIKNGDIDPEKLRDPKLRPYIWKAFCKYFVAAELYSHRRKGEVNSYYSFKELEHIKGFLRTLPAAAVYGEDDEDFTNRSMHKTEITEYFLSDEELEWIDKMSKTETWRVGGQEFAWNTLAGSMEGGWKFLMLMMGMSK